MADRAQDSEADVRGEAIQALGMIDERWRGETLAPGWQGADAVEFARDQRIMSVLFGALKDPGEFVRNDAANMLGIIGRTRLPMDRTIVEALQSVLADPLPTVQATAKWQLTQFPSALEH